MMGQQARSTADLVVTIAMIACVVLVLIDAVRRFSSLAAPRREAAELSPKSPG